MWILSSGHWYWDDDLPWIKGAPFDEPAQETSSVRGKPGTGEGKKVEREPFGVGDSWRR